MGLLSLILILSLSHVLKSSLAVGNYNNQFNVMDFGAAGNGLKDDSLAFQKAWITACNAATGTTTLIVPWGRIFLVGPTNFMGPCKATNVNLQIWGIVMAPNNPTTWKGTDSSIWLSFNGVNRLTMSGNGTIDGRGNNWWTQSCKLKLKPHIQFPPINLNLQGCTEQSPTMLSFYGCNELQLRDLNVKDSPQMHIYIQGSQGANVSGLMIDAPGWSPNTDGIHVQDSNNVNILNSGIGTGDDCISIGNGTFNLNIMNIFCGPGHGISVGSLGKNEAESAVEYIYVQNVTFQNTTNGARIKTWQGGKGYARSMSFKNLRFTNVDNPIVIDQYYCDTPNNQCQEKVDAVKISNITYSDIQGTSNTAVAVSLNCSKSVQCDSINFDPIVNITAANLGMTTIASCSSAYGVVLGCISPQLEGCLLPKGSNDFFI